MKRIAIIDGEQHPVLVERFEDSFVVEIDGKRIIAELVRANASIDTLRIGKGRQYAVVHQQSGERHAVFFPNSRVDLDLRDPLTLSRKGAGDDLGGDEKIVRAVMPGRVVRVEVSEGDEVERGKSLLVIEAMKMENTIEAPRRGTIVSLHVEAGSTVDTGAELVTIE